MGYESFRTLYTVIQASGQTVAQAMQPIQLSAREIERRDGPVHVLRDRLVQKAQPGAEMMREEFHGKAS